jgi:hypothetical protein
MSLYDYRGVIHCHSTYSDGTGTYEDIARAANEANLDFVIMSDHDTLKPLAEGLEKWHGSTLIICGAEISPQSNHYLVFGDEPLQGVEGLKGRPAQEMIDEVARQGWLGFLAHPDSTGSKRFNLPANPWTAWDAQNFAGMSVWNLVNDWLTQVDRDNATMIDYKEFENALAGPKPDTVKKWDELCQKRKVVAIGEVDNHNWKVQFEGQDIQVFPYETAFRTITNHVLLEKPLEKDPRKAKRQILESVRHGRLYISFDFWDDPTDGFVFEVDAEPQVARMGDEVKLGAGKTELVVTVPEEALINVYHNGESIHEDENDEALIEIDQPGVYRVEAMRDNLTWVLSNPIWVRR